MTPDAPTVVVADHGVGWGACSLRACSDRLFEGLSLQAFFIVLGSLLDLQFGMFVSWFCCGIRMQKQDGSMQDTQTAAV